MKLIKLSAALELENSGNLEFFFLGTGTAFNKQFYQNNVLVIKGKNHILIDCGTLCPLVIQEYDRKITDIRNFFLTHSHADHIGGMEEVGFRNYYGTKKRPTVIIGDKYKKILWNDSLRGGMGYSETDSGDGHAACFDDFFVQQKPVREKVGSHYYESALVGRLSKAGDAGNATKAKNAASVKSAIRLNFFDTVHSAEKDALGRSFCSKGVVVDGRILFTGDTRFDRAALERILSDFDIEFIFHDCASYKSHVHTSYSELKTLPEAIRKKIILCHYDEKLAEKDVRADGFYGFAQRGFYYNFDL